MFAGAKANGLPAWAAELGVAKAAEDETRGHGPVNTSVPSTDPQILHPATPPGYISASLTAECPVASLSRFLPLLAAATATLACETSSVTGGLSGGGGAGGGAPSSSQRTELMLAMEDEVESTVSALTLFAPGVPPSFVAATCPTVGSSTDTDTDGIPESQTLTFADPPCHMTGFRGGDFSVAGTLLVEDTALTADTTSYRLTYTDLAWTGTDPAATRTFTATRNGVRGRTATEVTVNLKDSLKIVRVRPSRANTNIDLSTTVSFVADVDDTVRVGQSPPSGSLTIDGTMQWHRSSENWTITIATPTPLVYDSTCTTTPQRISDGEVTLSGTISGDTGVLTLTWSSCGVDPTAAWASNP